MPPSHIGYTLTGSNTEYALRKQRGDLPQFTQAEEQFAWQLITHGHSPAQAAYQEAVIRKIAAETGGRFLEVTPSDAQVLARNIINSCYIGRVSRISMQSSTTFGVVESFNCLPDVYRAAEQITASERRPGGAVASDSKEGHWSWSTEGRQFWTESIISGEPFEGRGAASSIVMFLQTFHLTSRTARLGTNSFMAGPLVDMFGPRLQGVNEWMRRIKNTFDPGWASDATYYLPRKRSRLLAIFPLLQPLLFSKVGIIFLKWQIRAALGRFRRSP
jgi:glycolate oxidase